ncbi:MAG TPA: hypothetical protein PLM80_06280 [Mesotoga sp.]|jgi:hypothetical protein|nr:hypothetical protein [Mesotoga sp.]MDI9375567.1 hypothetical protein [Thermotogota bacterium]NLX33006.1 hypothetical protein [Thermotogaceae bacterium]MDD4039893.1 hypothetical protein [Mesotoga sp.]MDD4477648.1 hypothetical protein [Mesotoga sp.]
MYVAVMRYHFREESLERACSIWKEAVLERATGREGFVRAFIMTGTGGKALAVGMWEEKRHADEFMKTGVFKELLNDFTDMMVANSEHEAYEMKFCSEK